MGGEEAPFRQLRIAYQHMLFDRKWADEMLDVENAHIQQISMILVKAHKIEKEVAFL